MKARLRAPGARWVDDLDDEALLHSELDDGLELALLGMGGIVIVLGGVGTGKTEAVLRWALNTPHQVLYVQVEETEHYSCDIDERLYAALAQHGEFNYADMPKNAGRRGRLLSDLLQTKTRIIITDEAGTASRATFTRMRTMSDRKDCPWLWIIVGDGALDRMRKLGLDPCGNRLAGEHTMQPLEPAELHSYLAAYHDIYGNPAAQALIPRIDAALAERRAGGAGNRRSWDLFTYKLLRRYPGQPLTQANADDILGGMHEWDPRRT